ncbi:WD40 repeat-like protein [Leucogyrophana mollusca]|uniref:WD40 repeat-like protein n=1 Tax=Leucogyrophana mollusca TaxID=85980 RepID=A0ACB8B178_9AGAM|nr:WD40 repeat-like protein [Leucogyrophana mollusca]
MSTVQSSPYMLLHTLGEHTDSVSCVRFSPDGNLLASGGDDGNLMIWDPSLGQLTHRIIMESPIICLAWDYAVPGRLFCGCKDGALVLIDNFDQEEPSQVVQTGTKSSVYVICVDNISNVVAVGIGSEVHLVKEFKIRQYATFKILPSPDEMPNTPDFADRRIRARSLDFLLKSNSGDSDRLIVSYLNHGIVCWDVETNTQLWRIIPIHRHRLVGHASLSPDQRTLLVSNLSEGMDLYNLGQSRPIRSFKYTLDSEANFPLEVSFLHEGAAVACGSPTGDVNIWDSATGEHRQTLTHEGTPVQAITAHQREEAAFIVTATSGSGERTVIKLWRTKLELQETVSWFGRLSFLTRRSRPPKQNCPRVIKVINSSFRRIFIIAVVIAVFALVIPHLPLIALTAGLLAAKVRRVAGDFWSTTGSFFCALPDALLGGLKTVLQYLLDTLEGNDDQRDLDDL